MDHNEIERTDCPGIIEWRDVTDYEFDNLQGILIVEGHCDECGKDFYIRAVGPVVENKPKLRSDSSGI